MRFSLTALLRAIFLLGLASTLVAIEVARVAPRSERERHARPASVVGIPGVSLSEFDANTRYLDSQTGTIQRLPLPQGEYLEDTACSPWQDERGVSHIVGRWRKEDGTPGGELLTDIGLACFTYPGGEWVGLIHCEKLPQGGVCWFPDTSDRVLFATADGSLYQVSFHAEDSPEAHGDGEDQVPVRLRWKTTIPGAGDVMLRQPCWPRVPGFEHTILISLRYVEPDPRAGGYSNAELWWLRLDAAGTTIVAAGRLITPTADKRDESAPSVAMTPAGPVVSYLTAPPGHPVRTLHMAPVVFDARTGAPRADLTRDVVLAEDCTDIPPAFSPEGRWVYTLVNPMRPDAHVQRIAVPGAQPAARPARSG